MDETLRQEQVFHDALPEPISVIEATNGTSYDNKVLISHIQGEIIDEGINPLVSPGLHQSSQSKMPTLFSKPLKNVSNYASTGNFEELVV